MYSIFRLFICTYVYNIPTCTVSVSNLLQVHFNVVIINVIHNYTVLEIKPFIFQLNFQESPRINMIHFDHNQFKN